MQTKHQIQQLLGSAGVLPNKRFGQHFLIDLNLMRLLVDSAKIRSDDTIIEVGCGTGSLTEALAGRAGTVIAVEIDKKMAKIAKKSLEKEKNVILFDADILENKNNINKTIAGTIEKSLEKNRGRLLLISNLPYNVAAALMMNLVTGPIVADAMYVTVQKEVDQRMLAAPESKQYGALSIFLAATGGVRKIKILKPSVFWPQPQVDSAMISFVRDAEKSRGIGDMEIFSDIVNLFMQHRRKMLKACIKSAKGKLGKIENWSYIFGKCSVDERRRPEEISPEDYVNIANLCYEHILTK